MKLNHLVFALALVLARSALAGGVERTNYVPTSAQLVTSYREADGLRAKFSGLVPHLRVEPHWFLGGKKMWFADLDGKIVSYVLVDCVSGAKYSLFDQVRLAKALSTDANEVKKIADLSVQENGEGADFQFHGKRFHLDLSTYVAKELAAPPVQFPPAPEPWVQNMWPPETDPVPAPSGGLTARISGNTVQSYKGQGPVKTVAIGTESSYYARLAWSPNSDRLIAFRVQPGDRKKVYLIESSPKRWGPAELHERVYDRPGDKIDTFKMELVDPVGGTVTPVQTETVDYGDMPDIRWTTDKRHFTFERMNRGYSRWRVFRVDSQTGSTETIVDDHPSTFVDSTSQFISYLPNDDMIWRSEQDGWGQLYYLSANGQVRNRITTGQWVVRNVLKVDPDKQRVVFTASGIHAGEDPYFTHAYTARFDGTGLTELTPALGNHDCTLSPDGETLADTCSTVSTAPVHELRRVSDGSLLTSLGKADASQLVAAGWKPPTVFVAKGRDGKTDIWGNVFYPLNRDPNKRYPVIEYIYAGPQDSFVDKTFRPYNHNQSLADLGFVVVSIDGMGTRNRGKAFHDVCFKNLKDAGFPDRILWMKALAAKDPSVDISRVGIHGTSAGGQNSTGALLFHPEFYKVAVSSCGCHDNRLDKIWWNEQWMGYPVGPEYAASSNIENAKLLQGKLLLFVGELDTNVPPETTYRLADALEKANKDFDFLVISGSDHTDGGAFGERKRRDFFVRNLLGVEPPIWNGR